MEKNPTTQQQAKGDVPCHEKNPKSVKTTLDVEEWKTRTWEKMAMGHRNELKVMINLK